MAGAVARGRFRQYAGGRIERRLEPETQANRWQTRNSLVSLFHDVRTVGGGVVFQLRVERAGVLAVQNIDDLRVQLPASRLTARTPRGAHVHPGEHREPSRVEIGHAAEINGVDRSSGIVDRRQQFVCDAVAIPIVGIVLGRDAQTDGRSTRKSRRDAGRRGDLPSV